MPWKVRKRKCRQGDGDKGKYVVVKVKRSGKEEKESCHTTKDLAQAGTRARYASAYGESVMKITAGQLRQIIKEELTQVLTEADSDGDGELSPDELRDLANKLDSAQQGGSNELPSWAQAAAEKLKAMKNTQDAVVYTNTNLEFLDALEGAGVDFETGGMHIDELHFYKDGKEFAFLKLDELPDATAVSKAWADIVRQLGIS